jgi:hypothetical protein
LVFGFLYENEKESVFLYTNALMCCVWVVKCFFFLFNK